MGILTVFSKILGAASEPFADRRRVARVTVRRAVRYRAGRRQGEAGLVDLGPGGMRLETPRKLRPGTLIEVWTEGQPIRCQVAWCRRRRSRGLSFVTGAAYCDSVDRLKSSWACRELLGSGAGKRINLQSRGSRRVRTDLPGAVLYCNQPEFRSGRVRDLSLGGALLSSDGPCRPGTEVSFRMGPCLGLPRCDLPAEVISSRQDSSGQWLHRVAFRGRPEEPRLLEKYLSRLPR